MIEWWQLGVSTITIIITVLIASYNIGRTRKKDLQEKLDEKADVIKVNDLEKKVDKISDDCSEKTKELKQDFINRINELKRDLSRDNDELSKKFDMLFKEVIGVIKDVNK